MSGLFSCAHELPHVSITPGNLVEVIGASDPHKGTEGIVMKVAGNQAIVAPVDTNEWRLNGKEFQINTGLLLRLPTRADVDRDIAAIRATGLAAKLAGQPHLPERHGHPRHYVTRPLRKPPPK